MQMNTVKRNQQLNMTVSSKSQGSASVQSCCARNCISTDTALAAVSIFVIAWARFSELFRRKINRFDVFAEFIFQHGFVESAEPFFIRLLFVLTRPLAGQVQINFLIKKEIPWFFDRILHHPLQGQRQHYSRIMICRSAFVIPVILL